MQAAENDILAKHITMIDIIYHERNISKALIICDKVNSNFIEKLSEYNHNVSTLPTIDKFINSDRRLLVLSYAEFAEYKLDLFNDSLIDTIFLINIIISNENISNFKNRIVIYDLTLK